MCQFIDLMPLSETIIVIEVGAGAQNSDEQNLEANCSILNKNRWKLTYDPSAPSSLQITIDGQLHLRHGWSDQRKDDVDSAAVESMT